MRSTPLDEEIAAWLEKAATDLEAARRLLAGDPITSPAAFHCQQAVEKSLKALLVSLEVTFEKVHDLAYLFDLCAEAGQDLGSVRDDAERLTLFAVTHRYPGRQDAPSEEASSAFLETA